MHRLVKKRLSLTPLDSLSSMLRITHLKGGWPFVKTKQPNRFLQNYQPANYIEELALGMLLKQLNWEDAHLKAAVWYKGKGLMDGFVDEMTAIIENIPLNEKPFVLLIDGLIAYGRIDAAYPYLRRLDSFHPGAYSKKWLGTYYLFQKEYTKALDFLLQSFRFNTNDTQLLYNLAGAYLYNNDKQKALETIDKCLMIDGTFPGARIMKRDLERILGSGK